MVSFKRYLCFNPIKKSNIKKGQLFMSRQKYVRHRVEKIEDIKLLKDKSIFYVVQH